MDLPCCWRAPLPQLWSCPSTSPVLMPGKEILFKIQGSPKSTVYSLHLHSNLLFEVLPADFTDTRVSLWYTVGRCSCSLWIRHDHCQNAEQLCSPRNPHEIRPVNIASWIGNPKELMNFPTKPLPSPSLFKTQIIGWGWDSSVLLPFLSPPCWGWDFLWSSSQSPMLLERTSQTSLVDQADLVGCLSI